MDGFSLASEIEKDGVGQLLPYIKRVSDKADFMFTDSHPFIQKHLGDFLAKYRGSRVFVELKVERKWTGNLFIETWSNRSRETPGWLWTCRADFLWYYFLGEEHAGVYEEKPRLYVMRMNELRDWARGTGDDGPGLNACEHRRQERYEQENDTWGALLKISVAKVVLNSFEGPIDPTCETSIQTTREHMRRQLTLL